MEKTKLPFIGIWNVLAQQRRAQGKWQQDRLVEQTVLAFFPDGDYVVNSREAGSMRTEVMASLWSFDPKTGIVSFYREEGDDFSQHCIFYDPSEADPWFYFFEMAPGIPLDRDSIIDHHAYERWKVELQKPL